MSDAPDQIDHGFDMLVGLIRGGMSPESAETTMRSYGLPPAMVNGASERFRQIADRIITARDPAGLRDPKRIIPWYTGPRSGDEFWPVLRGGQRESLGDEAVESLDLASTKVVALLPPPWRRDFSGRGLVLGYVQSGKTSNYTAVIAKAADAGYRLFIVLSGIHNNLRRQTQARLKSQLVDINSTRWFELTKATGDFGDPGSADALLSQDTLRLLAVVKKNKKRLENLKTWLGSASASSRANCPVLIIDDEADQASVNTKGEDRAAINKLILELLQLPKVAYVGYTATPFANIFIDPNVPEDLYPRDFIVDLPRPSAYFGPERLFGREPLNEQEAEEGVDGLDMVLTVPPSDELALRPPRKRDDRLGWQPGMTTSLRDAIRWFLLATAARRVRGHAGRHSSMLIHTTQLTEMHELYRPAVLAEVAKLRDPARLDDLAGLWRRETARVPPQSLGEAEVDFANVVEALPGVLGDVKVIVDNYVSSERLDYGEDPQVVIVVGGNTLSRGLTLEGLVVSYFLRSASAYDTLLQMGRWFGYRGGYSDLPRIWTSSELAEYFQFLATVEAEIRIDVARYEREDMTPADFAVRVRTHPQLAITSALKMKKARTAKTSYSGRRLQTILFEHQDRGWLERNWRTGQKLIDRLGAPDPRSGPGRAVWSGVDVDSVDAFLLGYQFHRDSVDLVTDAIRSYIREQNGHKELLKWNVGLVSRPPGKAPTTNLSAAGTFEVGLINRAAMKTVAKPHANIKSLMSRVDRVMDLGLRPQDLVGKEDDQLQDMRPGKIGLLILYPINKDSTPLRSTKRTDLDALHHVLGVGLVFPDSSHVQRTLTYKSVELPLGEVDEEDFLDVDAVDVDMVDTEDSYNGDDS